MLRIAPILTAIWNNRRTLLRATKHLVLIFLLALGGYLVTIATLNYSGYCPITLARLSDDEMCKLVAQSILDHTPEYIYPSNFYPNHYSSGDKSEDVFPLVPKSPDEPRYQVIPYRNLGEFFAANPNSCEVSAGGWREGDPTGFWDHALGYLNSFVKVEYQLHYRDEHGGEVMRRLKTVRGIGVCGQIWNGF